MTNSEKRCLRFPPDCRLGDLFIRSDDGMPPEFFGPARGELIMSATTKLILEVREPDELDALSGLGHDDLDALSLSRQAIKNADLSCISRLRGLSTLDLSFTSIGDQGLQYLAELTGLERLNLTS